MNMKPDRAGSKINISRLTTLCTHLLWMRIASAEELYTASGYVIKETALLASAVIFKGHKKITKSIFQFCHKLLYDPKSCYRVGNLKV